MFFQNELTEIWHLGMPPGKGRDGKTDSPRMPPIVIFSSPKRFAKLCRISPRR